MRPGVPKPLQCCRPPPCPSEVAGFMQFHAAGTSPTPEGGMESAGNSAVGACLCCDSSNETRAKTYVGCPGWQGFAGSREGRSVRRRPGGWRRSGRSFPIARRRRFPTARRSGRPASKSGSWTRRGSGGRGRRREPGRPPLQLRTSVGAFCAARNVGVVRMAEAANTESTEEFLPRLGAAAKPGAQAVLVLGEAGRRPAQGLCRARKVSAAVRPGNRSDGAGRPLPEGEPLRQPGVRRRRRPDGGGPQGAGQARRRARQDRADGVAEPDRSFALSNLSLIGSSHFFWHYTAARA